jgi:GTPase
MSTHLFPSSGSEGAAGSRAVLVGVELKASRGAWTLQDSLDELARLAQTAGLTVAGSTYQKLAHPDAGTWIGSGKVKEIGELLAGTGAAYVLFDDELSPGQQRNLEKALGDGVRVIDRTRLILDIFSQHAHTREGKLQVELAQYQYLLPRLAGMRAGLAQQVGGSGAGPVGLRGPGETQLELDRRQARRRIAAMRAELEEVRVQRRQHRSRRDRAGLPVIALVGYTNAGKSSLLNALTGSEVLVQDRLFATLDPTTRRLRLPAGMEALLTDTVGFIRKIPHDLVAAFRATLEGIEEAAVILHVVDSSHAHPGEQVAAVDAVLADLELSAPRILVWNKVDLLPQPGLPILQEGRQEHALAVSARTGSGLRDLLTRIESLLAEGMIELSLALPWSRHDMVKLIHGQGSVLSREETEEGIRLRVRVPRSLASRLEPFGLDTPRTS